jgi:succinyl-diaminopimelate desuccinylase
VIEAVSLAQALIRCPSVTPEDAGALGVLEAALKPLGFICTRLRFEAPGTAPIENLYARFGTTPPNFCFAGHTDVVPVGHAAAWNSDPFGADIRGGVLYGRGAADMKSAITAFAAAAEKQITKGFRGSISLLITGDEEGPALNGTAKVLSWMKKHNEQIDHCIVGEPTAVAHAGDTIKIGRRGSMRLDLAARGVQGHTAYPSRALNPIPILAEIVARLAREKLDEGSAHFEPSTLAFTTFDVGNRAGNVSPAEARAAANIRFNDLHTPEDLVARARAIAAQVMKELGGDAEIASDVGALPFVTEPGPFTDLVSRAIESATGQAPQLSTTGGTSDARFIRNVCPVAEVGLAGTTMHKVDECAPVAEIESLAAIYEQILADYFSASPAAS